jgi:hypothetical protein
MIDRAATFQLTEYTKGSSLPPQVDLGVPAQAVA